MNYLTNLSNGNGVFWPFLAEKSVMFVLKMQMVILLGEPTLRIKEGQVTPTSERAHVEHGGNQGEGINPTPTPPPHACIERVAI